MHYQNKKKNANKIDLAKKYSFSEDEIKLFEDFLQYLKQKKEIKKDFIPISVFNNKILAPLETVVKYLREDLIYTYSKTAFLLNRKPGPIGVTYRNSKKKLPSRLDVSSTENSIPISIFKDSKMTIFETIVVYLKDTSELKFKNIAELLNRNYRTIWTVYKRAKKK